MNLFRECCYYQDSFMKMSIIRKLKSLKIRTFGFQSPESLSQSQLNTNLPLCDKRHFASLQGAWPTWFWRMFSVVKHQHISRGCFCRDNAGILRHVTGTVHFTLVVNFNLHLNFASHRSKATKFYSCQKNVSLSHPLFQTTETAFHSIFPTPRNSGCTLLNTSKDQKRLTPCSTIPLTLLIFRILFQSFSFHLR